MTEEDYYKKPNYCLQCRNIISIPEGRVVADAVVKKFCSRSCAASFNNKKFPKRSPRGRCKDCRIPIINSRRYCKEHKGPLGFQKGHVPTSTIPLPRWLIKGKRRGDSKLKKRLIKAGLLENRCYKCGLIDRWDGEALVLQMDHINGDPFDNKIENLQILCPNCHTQSKTWGSRNYKFRNTASA